MDDSLVRMCQPYRTSFSIVFQSMRIIYDYYLDMLQFFEQTVFHK